MSREANTDLVHRFVQEFWSQGNLATADDLMTADAVIVLPGRGQVSKDEFKAFNNTIRNAFPDWYSTEEEYIVEDDRVAERWIGRGTQQGEFLGVSPSGKKVEVLGFVTYKITNGKISEFRGLFDGLTMLQQIGSMVIATKVEG